MQHLAAAAARGLGQKLAPVHRQARWVGAKVAVVVAPTMQSKASDEDKLALVNKVSGQGDGTAEDARGALAFSTER